MAFADSLQGASWRGVPFGVDTGSRAAGRRKVRHDYPYRDSVWLEDQGKLPREFSLMGFLVANSAVYGGGDLESQIRRMLKAAETTGAGVLVHPSAGRVTVDLVGPLVINERWDEGGVAEVQFHFVQGSAQAFPAIAGALGDLVGEAAGLADAAGLTAFADALAPIQSGVATLNAMSATASEWIDKVTGLARDATGLYGTVSQLGGANYGRFFNGRNAGFLEGLVSPYAGATSVADLISLGAANRAAIGTATGGITQALATFGEGTGPTDVGQAVQAAVAALRTSVADPADGLRMLGDLAKFTPLSPGSRTAPGQAMSDLFQRASASAMAQVSATYAPSSADDASAARTLVLGPLGAAIDRAGLTGEDGVFQAYRTLRKAVVDDLGDRGGSLARLSAVDLPSALPAVLIAQMRYQDAARAEELVTQAVPVHPWFMPLSFKALSA
ncbi:MAG: DNA circularization N-terminal domain-containing protein [Pseudomonadota bacterium]